ncbi:MAG TPA: MFS transporter [Candidatus Binatia bacterium]|nr:MFS transporter [Candidatus Binatia bacterium]
MSANLRHNLAALGADYALFVVGLAFASQSTILPAFAAYLGASNVAIGAIPAVMTLGWFLPSLFAAGHTETLAQKLPFVLRYTVWERVPFAVLALAAFFLADLSPALALGLMLLMLLVTTGVGGVLMPAWMDVIARAIPVTLRGRFFAFANLAASAGGLAGSVATASILAAVPAPASYGVCFVFAAVCMALSYGALVVVREPAAGASAPAVPLREYLSRIPALLGRDRNLAWFLAARAFAVVGSIGGGFYTVYALGTWGAPAAQVGVFTTLLFVGQMVGNAVLGWLADRRGHRLVIMLGLGATFAGNLVAVAAPTLGAFGVVFVMMGIQIAAMNVSNLNVMLEFAPVPGEQPTYIGLGTTLLAPIAFGAPLAAGLLADAFGFAAVFVVAAVAVGVALGLLLARVRDPRGVVAPRAA